MTISSKTAIGRRELRKGEKDKYQGKKRKEDYKRGGRGEATCIRDSTTWPSARWNTHPQPAGSFHFWGHLYPRTPLHPLLPHHSSEKAPLLPPYSSFQPFACMGLYCPSSLPESPILAPVPFWVFTHPCGRCPGLHLGKTFCTTLLSSLETSPLLPSVITFSISAVPLGGGPLTPHHIL